MAEFDIECPGCGLQFTVPAEMRGDVGFCKSCGSDIPVEPIRPPATLNVIDVITCAPFKRGKKRIKKWLGLN